MPFLMEMLIRAQLAVGRAVGVQGDLQASGLGSWVDRWPHGERGKAGGGDLSGDRVRKSQASLQVYDSSQISTQAG